MHFADPVDHAGVKQDALGQRGLARVDVRGNPDVAGALQRILALGMVRIYGHGSG